MAKNNLLREHGNDGHARVTFVELFFDLVFVFAITQLSHALLHHFTLLGLIETTLLLMAVWWVWIYTSWVTNWLDPERVPVRLMLFVLMIAGLLLSTSIPHAYNTGGLLFAGAYVFMQVGRSLFTLFSVRKHDANNFRNFIRITVWLSVSGVFWISGGFMEGHERLVLWAIAIAIEYFGPSMGFWTPVIGRSKTSDWEVAGGHLAERSGLFIIIALGESIVVTGATYAQTQMTPLSVIAFLSSLLSSIAMWWIYFNIGAERASDKIAREKDPGRLARLAYTYIPIVLIAGIILSAVADEMVLTDPGAAFSFNTAIALITAPVLYLLGNVLFKRVTYGAHMPLSHLVGIAGFLLLIPAAPHLTAVMLSCAATSLLLIVALWETISYSHD